MSPLAAQCAGPGVHGAAPGVGAALEPRGAQDAGREQAAREVKLNQLGLEAHAASLDIGCFQQRGHRNGAVTSLF